MPTMHSILRCKMRRKGISLERLGKYGMAIALDATDSKMIAIKIIKNKQI
jgi:hypothetical protein